MAGEKDQEVLYANILLDRELPEGYLEEWTAVLSRQKNELITGFTTYVVFLLGKEWMAIDTLLFKEITRAREVHTIPHTDGYVIKGVVNIRGRLRICISLHSLLEVALQEQTQDPAFMVVLEDKEKRWVFSADDVEGIRRIKESDIQNIPVTVSKSTANYLKGVVLIKERPINIIDSELLLGALGRLTS